MPRRAFGRASVAPLTLAVLWMVLPASGDADPLDPAGSPVWRAHFAARDLEADGDADGDGFSNEQEAVAGTDPYSAKDRLRLELKVLGERRRMIRWRGVAGRSYRVQDSYVSRVYPDDGVFVGDGEWITAAVPVSGSPVQRYRISSDISKVRLDWGLMWTTDTDADGDSDLEEFWFGSDPADPDSGVLVEDAGIHAGVRLSWESQPGKVYQLENAASPGGSWKALGQPVPGIGGRISRIAYDEEGDPGHSFYRLRVMDPDSDGDSLSDWDEMVLDTEPLREDSGPGVELPVESTIRVSLSRAVVWLGHDKAGSFRLVREGLLGPAEYEIVPSGNVAVGVDIEPLPRKVAFSAGQRELELEVRLRHPQLGPGELRTLVVHVARSGVAGTPAASPEMRIVSPKAISLGDFGAVGDGVADDTAAVRAAFKALETDGSANTLFLPSGSYRLTTPGYGTLAGRCLVRLGLESEDYSELLGRDLLLLGEGDSVLYADTGSELSHTLRVHSSFRSLAFRKLTIEKSPDPRRFNSPTEPNGSDGVTLTDFHGLPVEEISFVDCRFVNCHCAIRTFVHGTNRWGKLGVFRMEDCSVENPYGANAEDNVRLSGGGQQVQLNSWMAHADYRNNVFIGGGRFVEGAFNPSGVRKDGSHFGAPLELSFVGNQVYEMETEAVYPTNTREVASVGESFVPPKLGEPSVAVTLNGYYDSDFLPGQHVNFRTFPGGGAPPVNCVLLVESYDSEADVLVVANDGRGQEDYAALVVTSGTNLSLQEVEPPRAVIRDNLVVAGHKIGLAGIATNARSEISGNLVYGFSDCIRIYDEVRTPLYPASRDSSIFQNLVVPYLAHPISTYYVYGIQSWGPDATIWNNQVVIQRSQRAIGICSRGLKNWVVGNRVSAVEKISNGYGSTVRSVGIGLGREADLTRVRANFTRGFDVGVGRSAANFGTRYYLREHESVNDDLAFDPYGLLSE